MSYLVEYTDSGEIIDSRYHGLLDNSYLTVTLSEVADSSGRVSYYGDLLNDDTANIPMLIIGIVSFF